MFTSKHDPPFASQWQEPVRRDWCKESLALQPSQRGDKSRGSQPNARAHAHTCSHCEWVDFRSRRRHRCLRFCVLQIIGQRSQLDSMRSQLLWDMLDVANAPLQVARAKEKMENLDLDTRNCWGNAHICTQGSLVILAQSAKDFNKLQRYLSGNGMVNDAELEFHPKIKLRHVYKAIFFSRQGPLLEIHLQQGCKCCAAAWGVEIWATKGQITSTACKNSSSTMLFQLQQSHSCDWKDKWLPRHERLSLHGGMFSTGEVRYWPWNVKSTIRKAELSSHSRPGLLWALLSSKLIGVVQSPSKKLLKWQLYLYEGLCRNTAAAFFC